MDGQTVAVVVVLIGVAGITASVLSYFRLQRHRADAVAMAAYRRLAADAVARQEAIEAKLAELTDTLRDVQRLLRSVE
jgi:hypothetical protein